MTNWRMRFGLTSLVAGLTAATITDVAIWAWIGLFGLLFFAYLDARARGLL